MPQESPLEAYFLQHGRHTDALSALSQRLYSNALTIGSESKTIEDLQHRLSTTSALSPTAAATLADLVFSHKQRLRGALSLEADLLAETTVPQPASPRSSTVGPAPMSLTDAAGRNLKLCKELAFGEGSQQRPADSIVAEIVAAMDGVRTSVRQSQTDSGISAQADNKK